MVCKQFLILFIAIFRIMLIWIFLFVWVVIVLRKTTVLYNSQSGKLQPTWSGMLVARSLLIFGCFIVCSFQAFSLPFELLGSVIIEIATRI